MPRGTTMRSFASHHGPVITATHRARTWSRSPTTSWVNSVGTSPSLILAVIRTSSTSAPMTSTRPSSVATSSTATDGSLTVTRSVCSSCASRPTVWTVPNTSPTTAAMLPIASHARLTAGLVRTGVTPGVGGGGRAE